MYPYRPGRFPIQMPMQRQMISPFMRTPMQVPFQQTRGLRGILSRLLGRGSMPTNFQGFPGGGLFAGRGMFGPGINPGIGGQFYGGGAQGLSSLMNNFSSGGIPGMLNNIQRVMGLAQQVGPMIQQYGPLVKNMPAMFKIMRALNSTDTETETDSESNENSTTNPKNEAALTETSNKGNETEIDPPNLDGIKEEESTIITVKPSKPKLYI